MAARVATSEEGWTTLPFRRLGAALGVTAVAAPLLFGTGSASANVERPSAAAATRPVYLVDCRGDSAKIRPKVFLLKCGDGSEFVQKVIWRTWGGGRAQSVSATLSQNNCIPACFDGTFQSEPARVTVRMRAVQHGRLQYGHVYVLPLAPNRNHFTIYSGPLPA